MPVQMPEGLVVSVSGFRGRVGAPLTPELLTAIAAGFGAHLQRLGRTGPVLVGRDSRTSGPMLVRAVTAGLQSVGTDVVDLGVVPTPTLMLAVEDAAAAGGIGVTASHNPAEWNALKLASPEGMFLDADESRALLDFLASEEPTRASWNELGTVVEDATAVERHLDRILELPFLDREALRKRRFRVALDCVRGAGGVMMPRLLNALGCQVHGIGLEPDGRFPRDPEPTAAHLEELGELVRAHDADIGLAVDPDVDRLSLVDETGTPLGEDYTLALAAAAVLRRMSGPVATNLSTSQVVDDLVESAGSSVVRAPVGEINVARKMQDVGAVVGGEGNGGVILPALHLTRDAPVGAALVLQHLLDEGRPLSELVADQPRYEIVKEKMEFDRDHLEQAYDTLEGAEAFRGAETDTQDGLRLAWTGNREWLHVRPSGTEPVVRLIAEAPEGGRAGRLVAEARAVLESVAG